MADVEAFQRNDHLQVDGIDGPLTQSALLRPLYFIYISVCLVDGSKPGKAVA